MATINTIKLKRSSSNAAPSSALSAGEPAYSFNSHKLYLGDGSSNYIVGGKTYTDMLDHTAGTLTASSAVITDANNKVDQLKLGNTVITGSSDTISTSSGNLTIAPTGNLTITHNGTIDIDAQTNEIKIKDNEAAALNITEDSNSYMKFVTTNSGEKILISKALEVDGTSQLDGNVTVNGTLTTASTTTIGGAVNFANQATTNVNIDSGAIDGATIGANSAAAITGTTITGTTITDGTASLTSGAWTGIASAVIDNITVDANTISTTNSNGNLTLSPNGTGTVVVPASYKDRAGFGTNSLVTKEYVDAVKQSLDIKDAVRVATTANGTLASAYANGQTVDGVTLATDDRILLKNQSTATENGVYTVNASGAPTRATDFDETADVTQGAFIFVAEGTANAGNGFVLTTSGTITLGSTSLSFTQFSGAGTLNAGDGLTTGGSNIFAVNFDDVTLDTNSDQLRLKGITTTAVGDLLIGAASDGGYTRLAKPSSDNSFLTMGTAGSASWTTTIDGGTF